MDQAENTIFLKSIDMHLHGISLGGVCTSMQVPEAGLTIDCGVVTPRNVRLPHLALTHGHVDHAGGVALLLGNRRLQRLDKLQLYVPQVIADPFTQILDLWKDIQGHPFDFELHRVHEEALFDLGRHLLLRPFLTKHIIPSFGYTLLRQKNKLLAAYQGLPGAEIAALRKEGVEVTREEREPLISFSGDTMFSAMVQDPLVIRSKVIVTELTFLGSGEEAEANRTDRAHAHRGMHTHLEDLIENLDKLQCQELVLMHLSRKHRVEEARQEILARLPESWARRVHFLDHQDRRA
jgi:ribonuclease Z